MVLLLVIGLLAGVATVSSPCVLPIMPDVLGSGIAGDRRRPVGIVVGLVVTLAASIIVLGALVNALGLPADTLRLVAVAVLLVVGVTMIVPARSANGLTDTLSRLLPFRPASGRGSEHKPVLAGRARPDQERNTSTFVAISPGSPTPCGSPGCGRRAAAPRASVAARRSSGARPPTRCQSRPRHQGRRFFFSIAATARPSGVARNSGVWT